MLYDGSCIDQPGDQLFERAYWRSRGTLEEVAEALTWAHIGHHSKPVGFLNVNGFYNPLIQMLDQMVASGFYRQEQRDALVIAETPADLMKQLRVATWPDVAKWVR